MAKFWLSCGHGAGDVGATAKFGDRVYYEHTVVTAVAQRVKEITANQHIDVGFVPTEMTLKSRIQWINKNVRNDSLLIELHMNSAGGDAQGAEMFYKAGDGVSQTLAEKLLKAYVKSTGQTSRGTKADSDSQHPRLAICRDLLCTGLLIELGFITNKAELEMVSTRAALGVANMVLAWYNKPFLDSYGSVMEPQKVSSWAVESVEKAKNFVGPTGEKVWENWERPQDELQAYTLAHILHKLGALENPDGLLTNERACVALDRLGLFTKK